MHGECRGSGLEGGVADVAIPAGGCVGAFAGDGADLVGVHLLERVDVSDYGFEGAFENDEAEVEVGGGFAGGAEGAEQIVELCLGEADGMAVSGGGVVLKTGDGEECGGAAGFHFGLFFEVGGEVEARIDLGALGRKEARRLPAAWAMVQVPREGEISRPCELAGKETLLTGSVMTNWPLEGVADCRARTQALR